MSTARELAIALFVVLAVAGCAESGMSATERQELQTAADTLAIEQIEETFHEAASKHDLGLMMSIWAPDATMQYGSDTYSGTDEIRGFFIDSKFFHNEWLSETPAYKIKVSVNGDSGKMYFECHVVDLATKKVVFVVGGDWYVERIDGKWLVTRQQMATPDLAI